MTKTSQTPSKGRFSKQMPGTWTPRSYDKILKRLGYAAIGSSLLLLLPSSAYFIWVVSASAAGVDYLEVLFILSILVPGVLYVPSGIAAVSFSKRRTPAGRRALRALCWAMVLFSAALSIVLYNLDRQFVVGGFFGLVFAPAMLSCERRVG